ncbi:hypothetical protein WME94_37790 [Sorangium sp. So ce429]
MHWKHLIRKRMIAACILGAGQCSARIGRHALFPPNAAERSRAHADIAPHSRRPGDLALEQQP